MTSLFKRLKLIICCFIFNLVVGLVVNITKDIVSGSQVVIGLMALFFISTAMTETLIWLVKYLYEPTLTTEIKYEND